jgi:hypothetical protein
MSYETFMKHDQLLVAIFLEEFNKINNYLFEIAKGARTSR